MAVALRIAHRGLIGQARPLVRATLSVAALAWMWLVFAPGHGGHWPAMVLAMMLPMVLPQIAHVRARAFAPGRLRAVALFLAPYLIIWIGVGAVAAPLLAGVSGHAAFAPILCLLAALWQFSPLRQRALRRCHARPVLAAFGTEADRDGVRFGLRHGFVCLATCLPVMLVMLGTHSVAVMFCLTLIIWSERADQRPDPRAGALLLFLMALTLVIMAQAPSPHMH